jgi:putative flippase GtrA
MIPGQLRDPKHTDDRNSPIPPASILSSTLIRWGKFNLVGAIGIGVQVAALFLLKTVLHLQYLVATAIAVEAAVLHNFVWHERFTWVDRISLDRICADRIACRTEQNACSLHKDWRRNPLQLKPGFFRRLWRFHLANGTVSVLGNLAIMKILVGSGQMNYLIANSIAIATCSVVNFFLSDQWVFES